MPPSSCPRSYSSSSDFRLHFLLKLFALATFVPLMATASQAQDKVELFGGYSYFRATIREGQYNPCTFSCPNQTFPSSQTNLNGWEFSAQYKYLPFFGGVLDFNGSYGKLNAAGAREHTYLVGPQISLPFKVSPFARAMIGIARESEDSRGVCAAVTSITCRFSLGSDTSWASAVGGGLDWHVAPFVAVRVFQIDSVGTHLHGTSQNQPRVSAGVVSHF
ncbi:MAG TPA: hypothetical protein VNB49_09790 [Candidatus Dormibacteraeota bacterium]|nr:hypothetical protein [Candidatus Dormibacteraeota bacterium]